MTNDFPEFVGFPKISRFSREVVITEKLDGTNAQVYITDDGRIFAGSRTRWITPEQDNHGFAKWVEANKEELARLGPGAHFGEWWGKGINKRYSTDKAFSLFNVSKWDDPVVRPACCGVVPTLAKGILTAGLVEDALERLRLFGSIADPTCLRPEGIVIFHTASRTLFKKTLEKDETFKGTEMEG